MILCDQHLTYAIDTSKQAEYAIPIIEGILIYLCCECLKEWEKSFDFSISEKILIDHEC
jgi:hypothetical protein